MGLRRLVVSYDEVRGCNSFVVCDELRLVVIGWDGVGLVDAGRRGGESAGGGRVVACMGGG